MSWRRSAKQKSPDCMAPKICNWLPLSMNGIAQFRNTAKLRSPEMNQRAKNCGYQLAQTFDSNLSVRICHHPSRTTCCHLLRTRYKQCRCWCSTTAASAKTISVDLSHSCSYIFSPVCEDVLTRERKKREYVLYKYITHLYSNYNQKLMMLSDHSIWLCCGHEKSQVFLHWLHDISMHFEYGYKML